MFWRRFTHRYFTTNAREIVGNKRKIFQMDQESENAPSECPICCKTFPADTIQTHVNRCIFLNSTEEETPKENKRTFSVFSQANRSPIVESKKFKKSETVSKRISAPLAATTIHVSDEDDADDDDVLAVPSTSKSTGFDAKKAPASATAKSVGKTVPLAEKMRPETIDDYIGQSHVMGKDTILRKILDKNETPSMILWGPPGVGKVTSTPSCMDIGYSQWILFHFRQHWPILSLTGARRRRIFDL